jgi:ribonuclease HI
VTALSMLIPLVCSEDTVTMQSDSRYCVNAISSSLDDSKNPMDVSESNNERVWRGRCMLRELYKRVKKVTMEWVPRPKNSRADALATEGKDAYASMYLEEDVPETSKPKRRKK